MTAYLACLGKNITNKNINFIVETLNPLKLLETKIIKNKQGFFSVSFHNKAPLKGDKFFKNKDWIAVFAGDLIEKTIPWNFIIKTIKSGNYKPLSILNGYYSIAILNKKSNKLYIISDIRSQFPIFYLIKDKNTYVSTELSTFCRLPFKPSFNIQWMWEFLFFNYPLGQTTFLKNVYRMPPASVLKVKINSGEYFIFRYASNFKKRKHLLKGNKALEHAYNVFKTRVPKYFLGSENIACALTGGWDARTNLIFCPSINSIMVYTYGIPGCLDLLESSKTAWLMNIKHKKILFDKSFENKLPSLILDTIYLSSGLGRLRRSAPLHVFRNLTENGKNHPLLIEGIDYDGWFRGHAGPAFVPKEMAKIFSTGKKTINEKYWKNILGKSYESFKKHILKKINNIEKLYGKLNKPETHFYYSLYESSPKNWAGLTTIAKHYATLRSPAWDSDIIDLSWSIENSTLSFSELLPNHKRGSWVEMILQSYMFTKDGSPLKDITIQGVKPKLVLKGKINYNFIRIINLLPQFIKIKVKRGSYPPLENWDYWINEVHRKFIDYIIFSKKSKIKDYIEDQILEKIKDKRNTNLISKFTTIEIILRLIDNNWGRIKTKEIYD